MIGNEISERTRKIYAESIVIDMQELPWTEEDNWTPTELDYFKTLDKAGITAINATVPKVSDDIPAALKSFAKIFKAIESVNNIRIVKCASDIENAKKQGQIALIFAVQDSVPFERDLDLLRVFYEIGLRVIQPTYFRHNYLGSGCAEKKDHGLTDQGREAVQECNKLGILLDASHCGDNTAVEMAEISEHPIALTHITPATLVEMPRAKKDATLKAIAQKGGVIGQCVVSSFCEKRDKMGIVPTIADYVDIMDYLVNLVGIDHIGFGFDLAVFWTKDIWDSFNKKYAAAFLPHDIQPFETRWVKGFNSISDTTQIVDELLKRNYSEFDTKKLMGLNWLRLIKSVFK